MQRRTERSSAEQASSTSSTSSLSATSVKQYDLSQQQQQLLLRDPVTRRPLDSAASNHSILPSFETLPTPVKVAQQQHHTPPMAKEPRESSVDQRSLRLSASSARHAMAPPVNGYRYRPVQDADESGDFRRRPVEPSLKPVSAEQDPEGETDYDSRFDKYYRLARELTSQSH